MLGKEEVLAYLKETWIDAFLLTTAIFIYLYHRTEDFRRTFRVSVIIFFINYGFISLFKHAWSQHIPKQKGGGSLTDRMKEVMGGGAPEPEVVLRN